MLCVPPRHTGRHSVGRAVKTGTELSREMYCLVYSQRFSSWDTETPMLRRWAVAGPQTKSSARSSQTAEKADYAFIERHAEQEP